MMTPFFIEVDERVLLALHFEPDEGDLVRSEAVLYVPPLADEANKARRMAALQARELASRGLGVLFVDPTGCGDSAGEHGEARWQTWLDDLRAGADWLRRNGYQTIHLWGLRLGALLALDLVRCADRYFKKVALWQPLTNGEILMTQFLRLRLAGGLAGRGGETTKELRHRLGTGESLEIGGYEVHPELVAAVDQLRMVDLNPGTDVGVGWFEVSPYAGAEVSPASAAVQDAWRRAGSRLVSQVVAGAPFWATTEVTLCPPLLDATAAFFSGNRT